MEDREKRADQDLKLSKQVVKLRGPEEDAKDQIAPPSIMEDSDLDDNAPDSFSQIEKE